MGVVLCWTSGLVLGWLKAMLAILLDAEQQCDATYVVPADSTDTVSWHATSIGKNARHAAGVAIIACANDVLSFSCISSLPDKLAEIVPVACRNLNSCFAACCVNAVQCCVNAVQH